MSKKGTHGIRPMTPERAAAIQRATVLKTGSVQKTDFAARATGAAARNVTNGVVKQSGNQ